MSDAIIKRLREAIAEHPLSPIHGYAEDIAALLDRLDKAERENERLRKDAERYRWLRGDACPDHSVRWTQWDVRCWVAPFWSDDLRREGLDRSIDAARAAEQPESEAVACAVDREMALRAENEKLRRSQIRRVGYVCEQCGWTLSAEPPKRDAADGREG